MTVKYRTKKIYIISSPLGVSLLSRELLQCLEIFLVATMRVGGNYWLLGDRNSLLSIPQCTGQTLTKKLIIYPSMSKVLRLRNKWKQMLLGLRSQTIWIQILAPWEKYRV